MIFYIKDNQNWFITISNLYFYVLLRKMVNDFDFKEVFICYQGDKKRIGYIATNNLIDELRTAFQIALQTMKMVSQQKRKKNIFQRISSFSKDDENEERKNNTTCSMEKERSVSLLDLNKIKERIKFKDGGTNKDWNNKKTPSIELCNNKIVDVNKKGQVDVDSVILERKVSSSQTRIDVTVSFLEQMKWNDKWFENAMTEFCRTQMLKRIFHWS